MSWSRYILALSCAALISGCNFLAPGTQFPVTPSGTLDANRELPSYVQVVPLLPGSRALLPKVPVPALRENPELKAALKDWHYHIGPGDILNIVVWDYPELTLPAGPQRSAVEGGIWVGADGAIFYPYIGRILVAGKTVEDIRTIVTEGLEKYIPDPQVDVTIAQFRSQRFSISGAVRQSGPQAVTNIPITLLHAINAAEAIENADLRHVTVVREGVERTFNIQKLQEEGDISQDYLLQANDIVHVPLQRDREVYVLGAVRSPGVYEVDRNTSLTEVLAARGGLDPDFANVRGIFVFRRQPSMKNPSKVIAYQLDTSQATAYVLGTQFTLSAQDLIYVTTDPAAQWNRLIAKIVPTLSASRNTLDTLNAL